METKKQISDYLERVASCVKALNHDDIDQLVQIIFEAYKRGSTIFVFGNGGSASTASHIACDLNKGVSYGKEKRLRVICLADNLPTITAYANDVGYADIFIEQLKNFLHTGDVVIALSGSGNSENVVRAVEYANSQGNTTVGLTGYGGGKLKKLATHSVNANIDDMEISEDIHLILNHTIKKSLMHLLKDAQ